jgi:hypothetical protein
MAGTTQHLLAGLHNLVSTSKSTQAIALDAMFEYAYRPMWLGLFTAIIFLVALRSASRGDDQNTASLGNVAASLMVLGGIGCLAGVTAYHGAMIVQFEPHVVMEWARITHTLEWITLGVCLVGGTSSHLQGTDWTASAT